MVVGGVNEGVYPKKMSQTIVNKKNDKTWKIKTCLKLLQNTNLGRIHLAKLVLGYFSGE